MSQSIFLLASQPSPLLATVSFEHVCVVSSHDVNVLASALCAHSAFRSHAAPSPFLPSKALHVRRSSVTVRTSVRVSVHLAKMLGSFARHASIPDASNVSSPLFAAATSFAHSALKSASHFAWSNPI